MTVVRSYTVSNLSINQVKDQVIVNGKIRLQFIEYTHKDVNGKKSQRFEYVYHKENGQNCVHFSANGSECADMFNDTLRTIHANYELERIDTEVESFEGTGSKRYYTA